MIAEPLLDSSAYWISRHRVLTVSIAVILVLIVSTVAVQRLRPAPPREFTLSTGAEGGAYFAYGAQYRELARRYHLTLHLNPSSGAQQNLSRLLDEQSHVDAAFVQGGMSPLPSSNLTFDGVPDDSPDSPLVSLGALYYEPLWVFYRASQPIGRLEQLSGKHLAIGVPGSGTRVVALDLLAQSGLSERNTRFEALTTTEAAEFLIAGRIDALFMIAGEDSAVVRRLLATSGLSLMSFDQALAYSRRRPYLSTVTLPQGVIDFSHNVPPRDVVMLATTANLLVRADLHPALMYVLLDAASVIHRRQSAFNTAGTFPSALPQNVPLAAEAERFYKSGKPFLLRYLPFWLATYIDRIWVVVLPLLALLLPLFSILPKVLGAPSRVRLQGWYRALGQIEHEFMAEPHADQVRRSVAALDELEGRVSKARFPADQIKDLYALRQAIDMVRERLAAPHAKAIVALRR